VTRVTSKNIKKQSTLPEFSHSEHTRFWYHTTNPNTPTDLIAALQFNPTPNNKHAFLGIILRLMGSVNQPRRGFESTHTARLARRFSSSLAPISTASQNATKMIHFLGAFLRTMMPLAPMLGHYTTTRPRKSSPSAVDTAVVLRASMPQRTKSPNVTRNTRRFSCRGNWLMESLRMSSPNPRKRG